MLTFEKYINNIRANPDVNAQKKISDVIGGNEKTQMLVLLDGYYLACIKQASQERTVGQKDITPTVTVKELLEQLNILYAWFNRMIGKVQIGEELPVVTEEDKDKKNKDYVNGVVEDINVRFKQRNPKIIDAVRKAANVSEYRSTSWGTNDPMVLAGIGMFAVFIGAYIALLSGSLEVLFVGLAIGAAIELYAGVAAYLTDKHARVPGAVDKYTLNTESDTTNDMKQTPKLVNESDRLFMDKKRALDAAVRSERPTFKYSDEYVVGLSNDVVKESTLTTYYNNIYKDHQSYKAGKGLLQPACVDQFTILDGKHFEETPFDQKVDLNVLSQNIKTIMSNRR